MSKPRRCIELKIRVGGDNAHEVGNALREIARWWDEQPADRAVYSMASGAPGAGYTADGDRDDSVTHDDYFAAIEIWKDERKARGCP